jgi:hypothetical protein
LVTRREIGIITLAIPDIDLSSVLALKALNDSAAE